MINPYKSRKKTVLPLVVKPNFPVTKIPPSNEEMMINPYELEEIGTPHGQNALSNPENLRR